MTFTFDPQAPLIEIRGYLTGPRGTIRVRFALDTGATGTQIATRLLAQAGIDLSRPIRRRHIRSATGGATAPVVRARQLIALGQLRPDFAVAAHDMPPAVMYDGLLGLDFLRGQILTLDFARGRMSLKPPSWWRFWR